jgi:hypothetical protein
VTFLLPDQEQPSSFDTVAPTPFCDRRQLIRADGRPRRRPVFETGLAAPREGS